MAQYKNTYISPALAACEELAHLLGLPDDSVNSKPLLDAKEVAEAERAYRTEKAKGNAATMHELQAILHRLFQIFLDHWQNCQDTSLRSMLFVYPWNLTDLGGVPTPP